MAGREASDVSSRPQDEKTSDLGKSRRGAATSDIEAAATDGMTLCGFQFRIDFSNRRAQQFGKPFLPETSRSARAASSALFSFSACGSDGAFHLGKRFERH